MSTPNLKDAVSTAVTPDDKTKCAPSDGGCFPAKGGWSLGVQAVGTGGIPVSIKQAPYEYVGLTLKPNGS